MMRVLTKDELLNLMAGLPPSVMAMDEEETITTLAATVIEQQAEIERLRGIVRELIEMLDYDRTSERYRVAVDAAYSEIDQ